MEPQRLKIVTPTGEELDIEIDSVQLSDSRAQMTDLQKIAKALGLAEDTSADSIVAKVTELADSNSLDADAVAKALGAEKTDQEAIVARAKELADGSETRSLEDRAKAEGKTVVDTKTFESLKDGAAKGIEASDKLKQMAFDAAVDKAIDEGRLDAKPETRERLKKLYDVAAEDTLADIAARPKLVNTKPKGDGTEPEEAPEGTDADRFDLDVAAKKLMSEDKDLTYEDAIDRVVAERSQS